MDKSEKDSLLKLYPDKPVVYGPYVRKDNQRKMLVLCDIDKKNCITPLLARVRLEIKLGRRLTGDETVDHHDEDRTNDDPDNLRLLPKGENSRKSLIGNTYALGREVPIEERLYGQVNGMAKLTDDQVLDFRRRYSSGKVSKRQIQDEAGMSEKSVRSLLYGDTYSHLPSAVNRPKCGRPKSK